MRTKCKTTAYNQFANFLKTVCKTVKICAAEADFGSTVGGTAVLPKSASAAQPLTAYSAPFPINQLAGMYLKTTFGSHQYNAL